MAEWIALWANIDRVNDRALTSNDAPTYPAETRLCLVYRQMTAEERDKFSAVGTLEELHTQAMRLLVERKLKNNFRRTFVRRALERMPVFPNPNGGPRNQTPALAPHGKDSKDTKETLPSGRRKRVVKRRGTDSANPTPNAPGAKRQRPNYPLMNYSEATKPHCSRCFGYPDTERMQNHAPRDCRNYKKWRDAFPPSMKCFDCNQPGHRRGDARCPKRKTM